MSNKKSSWADFFANTLATRREKNATIEKLDPKLQRNSVIVEIKNFFNNSSVQKTFRIGTEIIIAWQPFFEKRTAWTFARGAFGTGKSFIDEYEIWAHDYFDNDNDWEEPFNREFNGTVMSVLSKYPYETIKTATEGYVIRLIDLDGVKVGWTASTKLNDKVDKIFAETDKIELARTHIKNLLWNKFQGQPIVMRRNDSMGSFDRDRIVFEVDKDFRPLPSARATEYAEYLKRCIDQDVYRSVMLYGPPGTGKSTMARTLVNTLNLRSFRIRLEDIGGMNNSTLFEAINIFQPDAIIFDDFDRTHGQESLLETMEHFHSRIKLVIATVNRKGEFDEALLRPGRFDELVLVKRMDDDVIKKLLGEENMDVFEDVKEWPIAFIEEFKKRSKVMDKKEATKSILELAERVRRLDDYDENNDGFSGLSKDDDEPKEVPNKRRKRGKRGKVIRVGSPFNDKAVLKFIEDHCDDECDDN